jgi:uncharacterized protein (UPF0335 family)
MAKTAAASDRTVSTNHNVAGISGERLRSYVERIERLIEDRKAIQEDIKEVKKEAKTVGFDTRIIMFLIRERAMDKDDFDEQEALRDIYKRAMGMLPEL